MQLSVVLKEQPNNSLDRKTYGDPIHIIDIRIPFSWTIYLSDQLEKWTVC